MWHAAKICDDSDKCERMLAWGVAAGAIGLIISLFWCIITKFVVSLDAHTKWVAVVLTAFWVSAVLCTTLSHQAKHVFWTGCHSDHAKRRKVLQLQ